MLDIERVDWGNFVSNIDFLNQTGSLETPCRILEIGCGRGRLLETLHRAGHSVVGTDLDPKNVSLCPPDLDVHIAEGSKLPFDARTFDIVLSFDVFEHIPESDKHLAEVVRVLKPTGRYLLQTPNKWTNVPFEMVRWSRRYGLRHTFDFLKPPQHCALHTYWQLRRRFERMGFDTAFYDIEVVNDYFKAKVEDYLGPFGRQMLSIVNPDRLPQPLRTNFYIEATIARRESP